LRQQALCGKPFFTELLPFESFLDTKKQERFSYQTLQTNQLFTLLDTYGISPMRLSLLIQKNFSLETICLYDGLLKQIWNGVRYVWSQTEDTWTLEKATAEFDKNADALDSWIIGEFLPVRRRYTTLTTPEEVISFFPYLQQFIQKKLLARYLEVKKVQPEGTMQATMTILFSAIFQILHPFLPEYVEALLAVSGYQWEPLIRFPALKKTALDIEIMFDLFEMIYTFKLRLHIKKHQKIALFLKADPNFLALFNPRKPVIQILFNVEQISSIRLHETNPIGYEVGELQSMIVGIKVQSPAASPKKPTLDDLQQDYQKQLEYFEILRNEIINLSPLGASPLLENKKEEREIIKLRIEKLELAIQKLKMK
jgi:valyl-tRNA synthetase